MRNNTRPNSGYAPENESAATGSYFFDGYRLDVSRRLLIAGSTSTPVPERLFAILMVLLAANGEIVERATLAQAVWGDEGVTRTNLSQHIYMLRVLIHGRDGDQSYIRTVVGRGYRFAVPIALTPEEAEEGPTERFAFPEPPVSDRERDRLRLYSLGCVHSERRTASSLKTAIGSFESALRLDERYPHALVGLARSYLVLAEDLHVPSSEAIPRARHAAARALEIVPSSSTSFALQSELALFADWNWSQAERDVEAAVRLNPTSSVARSCAAWLYALKGDTDAAIAEARRTLMLQPGSPGAMLLIARILIAAGKYPEAVDWLSGLTAIAPEFSVAKRFRAVAQVLDGRHEDAIADMLASGQTPEGIVYRMPLLAQAYAALGDQHRAEEAYARLCATAKRSYVAGWHLAIGAVGVGRTNEAVGYLERAYDERECSLLLLKSVPWFRAIEESTTFRNISNSVRA
jgi:DNA-binding winged helix-turn-helix (wHTH) protein/Flp pilus assembly protein TadD